MKKQRLSKIWEGKSGALWEMWKWRMDSWDPDHPSCVKKHGSSHPHSPQIALEWCLELSLRWAHELLPRADLVDKMQRFVSNYPIKLDDLVLLCLFTASGMLALVQPPLPSENKKSIFVLHTGYGMKNVFSSSYRKFWRLFFLVTLYSNDISSAFTGFCRFLQNFFWTAAF